MDDLLPSFKVAHVSRFLGSNLPSGYLITQKQKQLGKTDTVFTPNRHQALRNATSSENVTYMDDTFFKSYQNSKSDLAFNPVTPGVP